MKVQWPPGAEWHVWLHPSTLQELGGLLYCNEAPPPSALRKEFRPAEADKFRNCRNQRNGGRKTIKKAKEWLWSLCEKQLVRKYKQRGLKAVLKRKWEQTASRGGGGQHQGPVLQGFPGAQGLDLLCVLRATVRLTTSLLVNRHDEWHQSETPLPPPHPNKASHVLLAADVLTGNTSRAERPVEDRRIWNVVKWDR